MTNDYFIQLEKFADVYRKDCLAQSYSRSNGSNQQQSPRSVYINRAGVNFHPDYGIGTQTPGPFFQFREGISLSFEKHFLVTAGAPADDVANAREEISQGVGAVDHLSSYNTQVRLNFCSLDDISCCYNHQLASIANILSWSCSVGLLHLAPQKFQANPKLSVWQADSCSLFYSTHSLKQMAVHKQTLLVFSTLLVAGFAVATPLRALSAETSVQVKPKSDSNLDALLRQGREFVDLGDYTKAIAIYQQAARLDAENPRIFSGIGYLEARQGNYRASVQFYQQAIGLEPNNADFQYALGYAMANLQNYPAAATAYRRAAQLDRKNVNARIGLGVVLFQQKDYSGAFKAYQEAIALDPKNWQAYSSMGLVLIQQGNFPSAVNVLQQAAELAPKQASVQLKLGTALLRSGKISEGIAAFEEAAKLEPRNPEVQLEIGEVLKGQNDLEGAIIAYKRAIDVRPNLVSAYVAIGEIQLQKQDFSGAIITFRRVLQLDPDRAEAYYNMGKAFKARDRKSEATQAFQQALDTYRQQGNNDGAQKAEAALQELKQ